MMIPAIINRIIKVRDCIANLSDEAHAIIPLIITWATPSPAIDNVYGKRCIIQSSTYANPTKRIIVDG